VARLEVIVPMKPLASAKSRLSPQVPSARREAAALLMLHRVLNAATTAVQPQACVVVGGDATVQQIASHHGCHWVEEQGHDLNSSLLFAMQTGFENGALATLFLPADLPQSTPDDVSAVVAASNGMRLPVGVRAAADGGTNALLVPTQFRLEPQLGENSFNRHADAARALGTTLAEADAPGLAFDVDTPEDLVAAEHLVDGFTDNLDQLADWVRIHLSDYAASGGDSSG
jgi:2-phospho-L-lactate guanylyltransferase